MIIIITTIITIIIIIIINTIIKLCMIFEILKISLGALKAITANGGHPKYSSFDEIVKNFPSHYNLHHLGNMQHWTLIRVRCNLILKRFLIFFVQLYQDFLILPTGSIFLKQYSKIVKIVYFWRKITFKSNFTKFPIFVLCIWYQVSQ